MSVRAAPVAGGQRAIFRPTSGPVPPRLGELWTYRELFVFLVGRDIRVRYAQTALGGLWTVFQPISLMLVFTLAFRKLGGIETADVPYPVFALAGLAFWVFVSRGTMQGANSLIGNVELVTKTSVPRLLLPLAAVVAAVVDFLVAFALLVVFAAGYGEFPTWRLVAVPAVVAFALAFALGVSLVLSAVNARYRDIRQSLPFLLQLWLFLSPIAYPLSAFEEPWRTLAAVNPVAGMVEAFRWAVLATPPPSPVATALAGVVTLVVLLAGAARFARVERTFADYI